MKKVPVMYLEGIGDVFVTTPAFGNFKDQIDVEITYLHTFVATRDILQNNPHIARNIFPLFTEQQAGWVEFSYAIQKTERLFRKLLSIQQQRLQRGRAFCRASVMEKLLKRTKGKR